MSLQSLEQIKNLKVEDHPLEFIMAVPGRRYGEFESILSALHEDVSLGLNEAKAEVVGQTQWQGYRLVWAHNPEMARAARDLRLERISDIEQGANARASKLDGQDGGKAYKGKKLSDSGAKAWMYHEVKEARLAKILKVDLKSELFAYSIDQKALRLAELNDGKLLIVTNVKDLEPQEVIARYKGLADIERGFRVLKDELEIGPIYHRLPKRIKAHASICFMALVMHRVLRERLKAAGSPFSPKMALQALRAVQKHSIKIGANSTARGISNINAEQTKLFGAMKVKKPGAKQVQMSLL